MGPDTVRSNESKHCIKWSEVQRRCTDGWTAYDDLGLLLDNGVGRRLLGSLRPLLDQRNCWRCKQQCHLEGLKRHVVLDHFVFLDYSCDDEHHSCHDRRSSCDLVGRPGQSNILLQQCDERSLYQILDHFVWFHLPWKSCGAPTWSP